MGRLIGHCSNKKFDAFVKLRRSSLSTIADAQDMWPESPNLARNLYALPCRDYE